MCWQADFVAQGNALQQAEIPPMMRLQQWLGHDVWWLSVSNLFSSGGFQLALIPLLLLLLGWPRLRQLLFAMLWLGLLVQASKEAIGWLWPTRRLRAYSLVLALTTGLARGALYLRCGGWPSELAPCCWWFAHTGSWISAPPPWLVRA